MLPYHKVYENLTKNAYEKTRTPPSGGTQIPEDKSADVEILELSSNSMKSLPKTNAKQTGTPSPWMAPEPRRTRVLVKRSCPLTRGSLNKTSVSDVFYLFSSSAPRYCSRRGGPSPLRNTSSTSLPRPIQAHAHSLQQPLSSIRSGFKYLSLSPTSHRSIEQTHQKERHAKRS